MKRTEPSVSILRKTDYRPSWAYVQKTAVVPYLCGHRGLVGAYRDQIAANVKESDK